VKDVNLKLMCACSMQTADVIVRDKISHSGSLPLGTRNTWCHAEWVHYCQIAFVCHHQ